MSLITKVQQIISNHQLFTLNDKVLLAVSGGADSMVMADVLQKLGYNCAIAHCNFQLRGAEADAEQMQVDLWAQDKKIPFHSINFTTLEYAKKNGISTQMAARELRYSWFDKLCQSFGYSHIAIAHNADDQVETFFLNLIRGTGLSGLLGIPLTQNRIVRPLLFTPRCDIEQYAETNQLIYCNDSSNASTKYARNKIRHNIVPQFKEVNPQFAERMQQNMTYFKLANQFIDQQMEQLKKQLCHTQDNELHIDIALLQKQQSCLLCLYYLLEPYGFKGNVLHNLAQCLTAESGKIFESKTHQLIRNRKHLIVTPLPIYPQQYWLDLSIDQLFPITVKCYPKKELSLTAEKNMAYLDAQLLDFPLLVRKWEQGDAFVPFGMKGKKKVSDFLIDQKISMHKKQHQMVVLSGSDIIWLVGLRIDDRYKITPTSQQIAQLTLLK